jgi:uncharacterized protein YkwD
MEKNYPLFITHPFYKYFFNFIGNIKTMKFRSLIPCILLLLLSALTVSAQSKMKGFYETKKYMKCIYVCDQNIEDKIEEQESYFYKSLSLLSAKNDKEVLLVYPNPLQEVLKSIFKMEKFQSKHPEDPFYNDHKTEICSIVDQVVLAADALYKQNNRKEYLGLYDRLHNIYPENKIYLYKLSKGYSFKRSEMAVKYTDFTEETYFDLIVEIFEKMESYFPSTSKTEFSEALNALYTVNSEDLQTISIMVVNLHKQMPEDSESNALIDMFREKYWQIDMLVQVNTVRAERTLCGEEQHEPAKPVYLSNCLTRTAQKYAELMSEKNHFSHTSPDGKSPWTRANEEGCSADGENIAMGSDNVQDALDQWIQSPGHCSNIMGYHRYMGIGESGSYWVQMFQ